MFASTAAHCRPRTLIAEQQSQCLDQFVHFSWRDKQAPSREKLRKRTFSSGNNRRAAGRRLDGWQTEPFARRRQDQGERSCVNETELVIGKETQPVYERAGSLLVDRLPYLGGVVVKHVRVGR